MILAFGSISMDQAEVQEIVGCLIDEERRRSFTLYARSGDVFLAEHTQLLGRERRDDLG